MAPDPVGERARFTAGLGLATFVPLVLAPLLGSGGRSETSESLGILVVVGYAGHLAVTGWLWTMPDVRALVRSRPVRLALLPASFVLVGASSALALPSHRLAWLLLGFFAWQFFHFQRQNTGLLSLVAVRWGVAPATRSDRRRVSVAGWCGTVALVARPTLLGLPALFRPTSSTRLVVHVAAAAFALCVVAVVVATLRSKEPLPVAIARMAAVAFMVPVFVFHTASAAVTGMVIAHGLQYLWVVGWRGTATAWSHRRSAGHTVVGIAVLAVVGGAALEAMSELHTSSATILRVLYGSYIGLVMAHFSVDAVVWRRSPRPLTTTAPTAALLPSPAYGRL